MKRIFILICVFVFSGEVFAKEPIAGFRLIPQPQKIELMRGKGLGYGELKYLIAQDSTAVPVLGVLLDGLPRVKKRVRGWCWFYRRKMFRNLPRGICWKSGGME